MKSDHTKEDKKLESEEVLTNAKREHYMNTLNVDAKASMKNRIIIGAILMLVTIPCLVFGNYIFAL